MKTRTLWLAATAISLAQGAGPAFAQSVEGSCVGSYDDANGNFVSKAAGGCNVSAPPAPSGGGGFATQQMQLDAAYAVGSAIGAAFASWLASPPAHHDTQRAIQQARQRLARDKQRQDTEREHYRQEHEQVLSETKGSEFVGELSEKELGNTGALPRRTVTAQEMQAVESLKNQVRTIDCAMAEVYELAEGLGPDGKAFAGALAEDVLEAERTLPQAAPAASGACKTFALSRDSSAESSRSGNAAQMVVHATSTRFADTGQTVVTIVYELSRAGARTKQGQSVVVLNSAGTVDCEEVTPAAARCLKRAKLAGGAFSGKRYCPRPPPDRSADKDYAACNSK